MNIPSNYTLEELIKYVTLPDEVIAILEREVDKIKELEKKEKQFDRMEEVLREQIGFARDLVSNINEQACLSHKDARKNSKEWALANYCITEIENSYFEL